MRQFLAALALAWFVSAALAGEPRILAAQDVTTPAGPPGPPTTSIDTQVPLREFLSSRIDGVQSELTDKLEQAVKNLREVIDERDRQYSQRFDAQNAALSATASAAKEATDKALASAKDAVTKANEDLNKRFDSVNEFRATLTDQASHFVNKDTAETRFAALATAIDINRKVSDDISTRLTQLESGGSPVTLQSQKDIQALTARITEIEAKGVGVNQAWAIGLAVAGLIFGVIGAWAVLRRPITGRG